MHLVISGYYGFGNAGDEAMLAAILEAIIEVLPHANITVISGSPEETKKKHGVNAVSRVAFLKIYQALKNCDLLISGGGSLLQDVTSDRSLYYYLTLIRVAKMLNKPVMLYAQGIGPLQKESARKAVAKVLNNVDLITVRDETSRQELIDIGVKTEVTVTADAVLSMHPVDRTIAERLLQSYKLKGTRPKIGVCVRAWKNNTKYRAILAKALDELVQEHQASIVFIPMQYPADGEESMKIAELMEEKPIVLNQSFTTTELLSLAGYMDITIGVRLHALVFGSLMEKPVVGISYDPKIDNFLKMIGKTAVGTIVELDKDKLKKEVTDLLFDKSLQARSLQLIRDLRNKSRKNANMAFELLNKHTNV